MSEVFLKIVNMSISASYFVAAVLLLRLILKKAPKWVNVLLWGLVAVRLVCPFSIESALSLIPSAETIPEQVITQMRVDIQTNIPQMDDPVPDEPETDNRDDTADQTVPDVTAPEKQSISVVTVLAAVWVVGVGGMLGYTAVSYFLLRRRVATAIRMKDNIYRSENVDSPFVLGFLGPKIYLPFDLRGTDLSHVIAHENAHIRRKDHWWKPFGFVLLAIHWFNPIMWVGYILLCRDIELACDEKVIKEMDSKTKADYTEALVACSVNRRVIAACPLAFGEVGVKERVKTVMNYKKPAFWIVIAAIALCVVVAVCFLTNPKDKGPQVGNPKMLEFPGVKWGMTPEEVKTALNIKAGQIIRNEHIPASPDTSNTMDERNLYVADLEIFGSKVTMAVFTFISRTEDQIPKGFEFVEHTAGEFVLQGVKVFLDEETDMEQLELNMAAVYGEGVGGTYMYTDALSTGNPNKTSINANPYVRAMNKRGSVYQEALNDPNYQEQMWVCTDPMTISEHMRNYYTEMLENNSHSAEDIQEWLNQSPYITLRLVNNSYEGLLKEAGHHPTDFDRYITRNTLEYHTSTTVCIAQYIARMKPKE